MDAKEFVKKVWKTGIISPGFGQTRLKNTGVGWGEGNRLHLGGYAFTHGVKAKKKDMLHLKIEDGGAMIE